jgi:hypothetical protein
MRAEDGEVDVRRGLGDHELVHGGDLLGRGLDVGRRHVTVLAAVFGEHGSDAVWAEVKDRGSGAGLRDLIHPAGALGRRAGGGLGPVRILVQAVGLAEGPEELAGLALLEDGEVRNGAQGRGEIGQGDLRKLQGSSRVAADRLRDRGLGVPVDPGIGP